MHRRFLPSIESVIPFIVVFVLWEIISAAGIVSKVFIPSPLATYNAALYLIGHKILFADIEVSMERLVSGFFLGMAVGISLGIILGNLKTVGYAFEPLVEIFRPVSAFAIIPIVILWLGIGNFSKIVLIGYGVFFPTYTNTYDAVRDINPIFLRAARSLGTTKFQEFYRISLPAAMPGIMTGLRIGLPVSFSIMVAVELVASTSGLGYLIGSAASNVDMSQVLVGVLVILALGLTAQILFEFVRRRVLKWHPSAKTRGNQE